MGYPTCGLEPSLVRRSALECCLATGADDVAGGPSEA